MDGYHPLSEIPAFVTKSSDPIMSSEYMDVSIYASSPNSLFMYDQEKMDMQSSLGLNTTCTSVEAGMTDEFDLNANYEVSTDISTFQMSDYDRPSTSQTSGGIMTCHPSGMHWETEGEKDKYIKMEDLHQMSLTPTLAELNMNMDLLDDINSYIKVEMGQNIPHQLEDTLIKTEPVNYMSRDSKEVTDDILGQAGGSSRLTTLTNVSPQRMGVKSEPIDIPGRIRPTPRMGGSGSYPESFTPMTAIKPELIVPRSQPISTSAPLGTIKEIDISDSTTLQNLLKPSESSQARVPTSRRRTVSETQLLQKATPPQRKRSIASAGLESMDRKWEEIKEFLDAQMPSTSNALPQPPTGRRERTRYDSTSSQMTLTSNEDEDSDSDKDFDDDSDSDLEGGHDLGSLSASDSLIGTKEKQHFWQYNVQSKGPKGTRVHFDMEEDPHVLNDFEDPVFDPSNSNSLSNIGVAVKHGGKARKGDGNDIVPSPRKLCQIGLQLKKINKQINDFVPVSELPSNARSKTRKEKNKLASRACRLKKKAQHEANKVKLHGLETEHRNLITVLRSIRVLLVNRLHGNESDQEKMKTMTENLDMLIKRHLGDMIAGNSTEYVNEVIRTVESGDTTGGLKIKATRSYPVELRN